MHEIDRSVPLIFTRVRGMRIPVTLQLVADVFRVPRIEFPDYPSCECLQTVSKDELMAAFCERPFDWGKHQLTPCRPFAKDPRFINMVMTFVLHPLSHYNSITEPRARFLLSLLEHLTIDFPFHFILSIIDFHLDSVSHDKLIFPSTITRILRHFSVPFPLSDHFTFMCAIDAAIVKYSKAQFRSRQMDSAAPPSRSAPSTSAPSSAIGDVTLGDIMAQLQCMNARLDTLSTKLYQVNVRVSCIAKRQATMGGFALEATPSPPPPMASDFEDEDADDGDDNDDSDDDDEDASSTDEMST